MKLHFHNEEVWRAFLLEGGPCPRCEKSFPLDHRTLVDHIVACAPASGRLVGLGLDVSGKANKEVVDLWLPFARGEKCCPLCPAMTPYRWAARVTHLRKHGVNDVNIKAIYLKAEVRGLGESEPERTGGIVNVANDSSLEREDLWGDFVRKGGVCPKCKVHFHPAPHAREHALSCGEAEGIVQALDLFDFGDVSPKVMEKWLPFFRGEAHCPACEAPTPYPIKTRVEHVLEHWVSKLDARALVFEVCKMHDPDTNDPEGSPTEGRKDDAGKLRWSLLPLRAMKSVVEVLEYGARKYTEGGWRSVSRQRYVEAAFRHVVALADGEKLDAESGLPHAAHAVCCLLFIIHFDGEKP